MTSLQFTKRGTIMVAAVSGLGLLLTAGGCVLLGIMLAASLPGTTWTLAVGLTTPAFVLILAGVALAIAPWFPWMAYRISRNHSAEAASRHEDIMQSFNQQRQLLQAIHDAGLLSEGAKAIAFRERDRAALRSAIHSACQRGMFQDARQLVDEMQQRLGYLEEGENLRLQVDTAEEAAREREIQETTGQIDVLVSQRRWAEAARQGDWLARRFPENRVAAEQPRRIQQQRDEKKRTLLKEWDESLSADDVDRSVVVLKELDQYLSPSEGEAYKDAARDVFRKRLQQLGAQFALYWHDQRYPEALQVARQIVQEFPNTRMAQEVRERLPVLEARALRVPEKAGA